MKCGSLLPCPIYCLFILHSAVPHTHTARRTAPGPVLRRLRLRQVRRARQLRSLGRAELRRRSTTSGGTTAVRGTKGGTRERQYGGSTVRERERRFWLGRRCFGRGKGRRLGRGHRGHPWRRTSKRNMDLIHFVSVIGDCNRVERSHPLDGLAVEGVAMRDPLM